MYILLSDVLPSSINARQLLQPKAENTKKIFYQKFYICTYIYKYFPRSVRYLLGGKNNILEGGGRNMIFEKIRTPELTFIS